MSEGLGRITTFPKVVNQPPIDFVERNWLKEKVEQLRNDSNKRQLTIVGEPGSGKTTFMASLAREWNCPCHFIRVDSIGGVTGVDPRAFLLSIGSQLYQKYGSEIFDRGISSSTEIKVEIAQDSATVVGRLIDELYTLPFLPISERTISVEVKRAYGQSQIVGEHINRLYNVALALDELTLLHVVLINPLKKLQILYPEETVLILIDAIDESLQHQGKKITDIIPKVSDADFPANLRLLMTSRRGEHLSRFRDKDLFYLDDRPELLIDVKAYINKRLAESPLSEVIALWNHYEVVIYMTEIEKNSDGNFLYLYHFFNQLIEDIKAGKTELRQLVIPNGLDDIYQVFVIDKIKAKAEDRKEWLRIYLPLLGVLAVIREPIGREQLAKFAGVEVETADCLIAELEQFLDVIVDEIENRYQLYHNSFSEYLLDSSRNRKYPLNRVKYHVELYLITAVTLVI